MSSSSATHSFFFFNDTATTEIYTLSLHDALPISRRRGPCDRTPWPRGCAPRSPDPRPQRRHRAGTPVPGRSEEHTSELQSHSDLVCRLLLEKKKTTRPAIASRRKNRTCPAYGGMP